MIVDCAHYRDGERQASEELSLEDAAAAARTGGGGDFVWLGLLDPEPEELTRVGELFDLHELAVEDAANQHQRPKIEGYGDSIFVVLRSAAYDDAEESVHFGEIHIFLGSGYAISVRHGHPCDLRSARERLEARPELLREGPVSVAWAIVDKVVDDYEPVVEGIDNDIGEVEEAIFTQKGDSTQRIYFLKREVITFQRAVQPLQLPLESVERGNYAQVSEQMRRFFRDVADHVRRANERINSQRELLTSILEANLALLGVRQNAVVRSISAWAAIIAVPTFIASVYGMNFRYMPELDTHFGYPLALAVMALSVLALYRFFRRIDWLGAGGS
ncbi:magnesium/cobalt transporter CorA [Thermoleophilia bacterium SCSIO 60948]|nr:magnesium/cobalt transporter CorA [Thermoleophilia bacterium SCSIO 60948]